jgi:nucleotide-binding universal stress UspA family protein
MMIRKVLVPIDFSPLSETALTYATQLATELGARLFLLHVPGETGENLEADFPVGQFATASGERFGERVSPQGTQPRLEYASWIGVPATEIVRYADARDIDLIVMGTHGRSGLAHVVMGSVAEQVVRTASCPVVLLRRVSETVRASQAAVTSIPIGTGERVSG